MTRGGGERTPEARTQARLLDMLRRAHAGEEAYGWLNLIAERAGYFKLGETMGPVMVTAKQLEHLLERSTRAVRILIAEGLPCAKPGIGAKPSLFDAKAVLDWVRTRESGDPMLAGIGGGTSKALEAYRREMARKAKRENELAEGVLVERTDVIDKMNRLGKLLRAGFEGIGRLYGAEVEEAIQRILDDAEVKFHASIARAS